MLNILLSWKDDDFFYKKEPLHTVKGSIIFIFESVEFLFPTEIFDIAEAVQ